MNEPPTIEAIATASRAAAPVYVPEFFRLPRTGERDPYFGNSRSQYYAMERAGEIKLVHLRPRGKTRGTCFVPYEAVAARIRTARTGGE